MAEEPRTEVPTSQEEVTENDKLMAALSYPVPIVGIIVLLAEDLRSRPFQRYRAIQSLAANVVLWVIIAILAAATFFLAGCGGFLPLLLWLATFYGAYLAYQGQYFEIPIITDFIRNQGWIE